MLKTYLCVAHVELKCVFISLLFFISTQNITDGMTILEKYPSYFETVYVETLQLS